MSSIEQLKHAKGQLEQQRQQLKDTLSNLDLTIKEIDRQIKEGESDGSKKVLLLNATKMRYQTYVDLDHGYKDPSECKPVELQIAKSMLKTVSEDRFFIADLDGWVIHDGKGCPFPKGEIDPCILEITVGNGCVHRFENLTYIREDIDSPDAYICWMHPDEELPPLRRIHSYRIVG